MCSVESIICAYDFLDELMSHDIHLLHIAETYFISVSYTHLDVYKRQLITWVLGMIAQAIGWYQVDIDAGMYSLFPDFSSGIKPAAPTMFAFDFGRCV